MKLLIFDLDGTLINSDECILNTWYEIFEAYKPKSFNVNDFSINDCSGPPLIDIAKKIYPENYDFIVNEYIKRTNKYYDTNIYLFENELKYLSLLKEEGYVLVVDTNKNYERTSYILKRLNLFDLFSFVVSGDTVLKQKPDNEGIELIKEKTYILDNSEILFIGDTKVDLETARNANIKCVIFKLLPREIDVEEDKNTYIIKSYKKFYELVHKLNQK